MFGGFFNKMRGIRNSQPAVRQNTAGIPWARTPQQLANMPIGYDKEAVYGRVGPSAFTRQNDAGAYADFDSYRRKRKFGDKYTFNYGDMGATMDLRNALASYGGMQNLGMPSRTQMVRPNMSPYGLSRSTGTRPGAPMGFFARGSE